MTDLMQDGPGCAETRRYARWFADRLDAMWLLRQPKTSPSTTMTTPDLTEARRLADSAPNSRDDVSYEWEKAAEGMLRALADELERLHQAAALDLRDDVIESLQGDVAELRQLYDVRGRRLDERDEELERLRAQVAPAGWKLVPVELSAEMRGAFRANGVLLCETVWKEVLAASPAAPAQQAPTTPEGEPLGAHLLRLARKHDLSSDMWAAIRQAAELLTPATAQQANSVEFDGIAPAAPSLTVGERPLMTDDEIDAIVTRHYRDRRHPDSYVALRETIKDAIYEDRAATPNQPAAQAEPVALPGTETMKAVVEHAFRCGASWMLSAHDEHGHDFQEWDRVVKGWVAEWVDSEHNPLHYHDCGHPTCGCDGYCAADIANERVTERLRHNQRTVPPSNPPAQGVAWSVDATNAALAQLLKVFLIHDCPPESEQEAAERVAMRRDAVLTARAALAQAPAAVPLTERDAQLLLGDYFTHDRSGARMVCRAIVRHGRDDKGPRTLVEIEPYA